MPDPTFYTARLDLALQASNMEHLLNNWLRLMLFFHHFSVRYILLTGAVSTENVEHFGITAL